VVRVSCERMIAKKQKINKKFRIEGENENSKYKDTRRENIETENSKLQEGKKNKNVNRKDDKVLWDKK
jgi:hypothetical protein